MLRYLSMLTVLVTCLFACNKEVEPKFGILEEKLNISVDFNLLNGISVIINKAIPVTTKSYLFKDLTVNDANVYLIDSLSNTRWLIPFIDAISTYYKPDLSPIEGHSYKIEIVWNGNKYSSTNIFTPRKPIIKLINKDVSNSTFMGDTGYKVQYRILIDSVSKDQYFTAGAYLTTQHIERYISFIEYIQKEELCGYKYGILPSQCLENKVVDLKMLGYILKSNVVTNNAEKSFKGKHYIYFSSVSASYYNYILATADPEPFERYFLNPTITPTDFPEAFGTFLIRNMVILDSIDIK